MSPPETYFAGQVWSSDVRELVERFYEALRDRDLATVDDLIDERFLGSVTVHEPESLPFGGVHSGPAAAKRLFAALAARDSPVSIDGLSIDHVIESVSESDQLDQVVVALTVPWRTGDGSRAGALAWWTFENLGVARIRSRVSGPSIHSVVPPVSTYRPSRSDAVMSSWHETVYSGSPRLDATNSTLSLIHI